jgi:hypothetical protein
VEQGGCRADEMVRQRFISEWRHLEQQVLMSSIDFIVDTCILASEVHVVVADFTYDCPLSYTVP